MTVFGILNEAKEMVKRKRKPSVKKAAAQSSKVSEDALLRKDVEELKRCLGGLERDIEDCRRDVRDCRQDVKDALKKRWLRPAFLVFVLAFLGYTSWSGLKDVQEKLLAEAEKRLKQQVEALYEEKNVARVVDEVIRHDANDLIRKMVETEIDPIVRDLRAKQEEQSKILTEFKKDQERYAKLTLLHDLTIKAESGDLPAFRALSKVAEFPEKDLSEAALASIRRIHEVYFGQSNIIRRHYEVNVPDSQVREYLRDGNSIRRKLAVCTVRSRKMYDDIPFLIERIPVERNLDVLAAMEATLNELLDAKYRILHDEAQSKYRGTWEQRKDTLLKGVEN